MHLVWDVEWEDKAVKALRKLDHHAQKLIHHYLKKRIATSQDPRRFGDALTGDKSGLWRYRVGGYRVICRIEEDVLPSW